MSEIISGGVVLTGYGSSAARNPAPRAFSEGPLVSPPRIVREADAAPAGWETFRAAPSPVSDPTHELAQFRMAWQELNEMLAQHLAPEAPEVFEMPSAPTTHVRARVRHVGPAPFTFVDDFADESGL